jgi:hypothetical protein
MSEFKVKAVSQFINRKDYSTLLRKVDENGAHQPEKLKFFYCVHCGAPVDFDVENAVSISDTCSNCVLLVKRGWMEEAIRNYEGS